MLVRTGSLSRRAAVLAGAAGLAIAAAMPASGAATPGWRVVKTIGPSQGVWTDNFVATGAANAWSTWVSSHFYVERWTGRAWRQVPVPRNLAGDAASSVAIGASSARNAWLFDPGKVLRWNGSTWQLQRIPAWVVHINLSGTYAVTSAVFGPSSVWVFSMGVDNLSKPPDHYAAYYNGHAWARVQLPGIPGEVSALSPTDIWVLGVTTASALRRNPTYILMHWNGKTWSTVHIPTVTPPAGAVEFPVDLAAAGPGDAWLQRDIEQGSAGARTLYLLHWNGRSWATVRLGFPTSFVDSMAQDGYGGVWMVANGPARAYRWFTYHLNAGRWTRYTVPVARGLSLLDLTGITWIPGTRSLWVTGNMLGPPPGNAIYGAILKHGA